MLVERVVQSPSILSKPMKYSYKRCGLVVCKGTACLFVSFVLVYFFHDFLISLARVSI